MWQRIQTLYLAISTILCGILFFAVKAATFGADGEAVNELRYIAFWPYLVLLIIITFLHLLALFTYKQRVFQMRTAGLAALFCLALQIWLGVDWWFTHDLYIFRLTALFPLVSIFLDILAYRGILADQLLVESASHLRAAKKDRRK